MPGRRSGKKKSKRWLAIESAVAVLESGLAPGARVEHNVWLVQPATNTPRQCDVVITTGQAPRETRSIVEVQARKKKVGIAQFQSWVRKQEQLQVQHLICVSTSGFVKSVQREAQQMGERVRLLTLLPSGPPPRWEATEIRHKMEILVTRDAEVAFEKVIPAEANARVGDPIYRWDRTPQPISIMDIAEAMLRRGEARELKVTQMGQDTFERTFSLSFTGPGNRVWVPTASGDVRVGEADIRDQVRHLTTLIPIEVLSYKQFKYAGELGWAILARGEYEGREFHIRTAVRTDGGRLRISRPHLIGLDDLTTDWLGLRLFIGHSNSS